MQDKFKKKEALGLGIRALLTGMDEQKEEKSAVPEKEVVKEFASNIALLPLEQIEVNPYQPRKDFSPEALEDLANSIKIHGLIQPITVRRVAPHQYQLISGERRLRASRIAGLIEIPAYIRLANDQELMEMALIENIQRDDLNDIEVAITYQRLIDEFGLTQEDMATRVGKGRSTITNYLGLLKLPPNIQDAIRAKSLSMGHAKALNGVKDPAMLISIFQEVLRNNYSVRQTEELVKSYNEAKAANKIGKPKEKLSPVYRDVQDRFSSFFGTKVTLKEKGAGKGQVILNFSSDDELNRFLDALEK